MPLDPPQRHQIEQDAITAAWEPTSTRPAVTGGLMLVNHAKFEALFAGLDWRRVRAIEAKAPEAVD